MAQYIFYPEATRGHTDIDWLNARHAFNFARFDDPQRNPFGALVILNEDTIQPGKGFGTHGHQNMEIISIILEGRIRHVDSMGNEGFIDQGEAQLISAGTGITHSEFNYYDDRRLKLLQIWIRPDRNDIRPKYAQMVIDDGMFGVKEILSPNGKDGSMRIHQQAWMYLARLPKDEGIDYKAIRPGNGVYVHVLDGQLSILGKQLWAGDAIGVTAAGSFDMNAESDVLAIIIDVPMN
jgi:redox-sensitive bicupin YhaK (pirin superfamily)